MYFRCCASQLEQKKLLCVTSCSISSKLAISDCLSLNRIHSCSLCVSFLLKIKSKKLADNVETIQLMNKACLLYLPESTDITKCLLLPLCSEMSHTSSFAAPLSTSARLFTDAMLSKFALLARFRILSVLNTPGDWAKRPVTSSVSSLEK